MPTFDFRCQKCGHVFEFTRPFGSKTMPVCPTCKSKKTEKLMTPPAVHFKGAGWYKTDSRPAAKPEKKVETATKETKATERTKETKESSTAESTKADAKESSPKTPPTKP